MTEWEYQRVSSSIAIPRPVLGSPKQSPREIHADWIELLNTRGAEGWELVTERYSASEDHLKNFVADYSGTMKRPRR